MTGALDGGGAGGGEGEEEEAEEEGGGGEEVEVVGVVDVEDGEVASFGHGALAEGAVFKADALREVAALPELGVGGGLEGVAEGVAVPQPDEIRGTLLAREEEAGEDNVRKDGRCHDGLGVGGVAGDGAEEKAEEAGGPAEDEEDNVQTEPGVEAGHEVDDVRKEEGVEALRQEEGRYTRGEPRREPEARVETFLDEPGSFGREDDSGLTHGVYEEKHETDEEQTSPRPGPALLP
mmetsp:Transcript_21365/g.65923  ORF Transcript_21365/g.65923 Transcript_21365/m.65923 type:complete len:235 (+) Transcript_21365:168-872(+)